jgi:hypothetical protein
VSATRPAKHAPRWLIIAAAVASIISAGSAVLSLASDMSAIYPSSEATCIFRSEGTVQGTLVLVCGARGVPGR